jgi:hypothetical protein
MGAAHGVCPTQSLSAHNGAEICPLISKLLDGYDLLCNAVVTHSGAGYGRRYYWPHPLYPIRRCAELPAELDLAPGYFVVFGRIENANESMS